MKIRPLHSNISQKIRREAGDTLIEVTMALSILSMVLISSTVIAAQAFRLGQTARERTTISTAAQAQMEAVRAFRDNNTWDHFEHGDGSTYPGVLNAAVSTVTCLDTSTPCMHMQGVSGKPTFTPVDASMASVVPTSHIDIVAAQGPSPDEVVVTVDYWFDTLGSGKAAGHIKTTFSNLTAGPAPTPTPIVIPPPVPTYLDCQSAAAGNEQFYLPLWDYPAGTPKDWHLNYIQPATPQHINSTIPFLRDIPAGEYAYWAIAKDASFSGTTNQKLHFLFYAVPNPVVGVSPSVGQTADTPDLVTSGVQASTSGIITLSQDVKSVMAQHAAQIPTTTDDGVDAACLVLRPI